MNKNFAAFYIVYGTPTLVCFGYLWGNWKGWRQAANEQIEDSPNLEWQGALIDAGARKAKEMLITGAKR